MDGKSAAQDSVIIESVNNLIFDRTEALLPPTWRWLPDCDVYQHDDLTAQKKIAIRFGDVYNATIVIKSITIIGNEVFYRVMGKLAASPKFLPQFIQKVEDITNLMSNFESSSLCQGFNFAINNQLTPRSKSEDSNAVRRSRFCLQILEKGNICYKCNCYKKITANNAIASKLERLINRSEKI